MEIKNKAFLIAGGGSGLGAATAQLLAASGANVVIADVNEQKGKALAEEIGATSLFVKTDVTDEGSVNTAIDLAIAKFGALRGAINCAGIGVAEKTLGKDGPHSLSIFKRV